MSVAENWLIERRPDGALLVRVPSTGSYGNGLPDAVFTFRAGEPQYDYWRRQIADRETANESDAA